MRNKVKVLIFSTLFGGATTLDHDFYLVRWPIEPSASGAYMMLLLLTKDVAFQSVDRLIAFL